MKISRTFYNKPSFWIWFIIVFNCTYRALCYFLNLPSSIVYLSDVAWIVLSLMLVKRRSNNLYNAKLVKSKMKCWCCPHRSHKKIQCIVFDLRSSPPWIWRKYERRPLGCLYLSTPLQRRGWVSPLPPIVSLLFLV